MGLEGGSQYAEEKREACGIVGIYSKKGHDVAPHIYRALVALQHRGQDASGLAVFDGRDIEARRGIGLAMDVFEPADLLLKGRLGIGHTRYPTYGECRACDVQPMVYGKFAAAHNGHLANCPDIRKGLEREGYSFMSSVDSEAVVYILDKEGNVDSAIRRMMKSLEGSYSVAAIADGMLVVFRDPLAIRPLVWGENEDFICFASETVALDAIGVPYKGDISGGEYAIVDRGRVIRKRVVESEPRHCMFEYVYFSRPDSDLDGRSVYGTRKKLGRILAAESPAKADVVVPVPDTSRTAASGFADALGLPCEEGLIKNRYIGRTFIMPSQQKRSDAVRMKINPVREIVCGKSVVLIDDSIVRGTTLGAIVSMVRRAGAREVHLRITCPPLRAPCFYGVDMSSYGELIANKKTIEEIRKHLGADSLAFVSLKGLLEAIGLPLCTACLGGDYNSAYVKGLAEKARNAEEGK